MTAHVTTGPSTMSDDQPQSPASPAEGPRPSANAGGEPKPWILRPAVRATIYLFLILFLAGMIAYGLVPRILDPTFEKHIQRGDVMVGMTREQVMQAWGAPYQTNVTHTSEGVRREEWVYEDWKSAAEVRHRYLYFEEGILQGGWYYE